MGTITEIQALQNAAISLGLTIYEKFQEDKRRTVGRYYAQNGDSTVSPVLDYGEMNHFLLGWRRALDTIKN